MIEPELRLNWVPSSLKDVANEFISGGTPSTKETDFWDGEIPWTTSSPISEQDVILNQAQRYITQKGLQNSASNIVPKGNLIVGTRVGVGKSVTNAIDIAISQDLTGVVLNHEKVMPEFIAYFFKIQKVQQYLDGRKRGTTIKGISRFDLQTLKIDLPPLPEQRAIARALRAVQGAREARLREVALERERKAALMEHLFTHGTRGEATKMTEIGEMPESWKVVTLGDRSFRPDYGYTASASKNPSGPKFLRITDIQEDHVNWDSVPYCDKYEGIEENYKLKSGDLVIARIGATTGKIYLIHNCPDAIFASYLIRVRTRPGLSPDFLYFYCQTKNYWEHINQNKGGRLKGGVNIPILQRLPLPFPAVSEQDSISKVLLACDSKIAALDHEARLYDELFRAMLEELMSGRLPAGALVEDAA